MLEFPPKIIDQKCNLDQITNYILEELKVKKIKR